MLSFVNQLLESGKPCVFQLFTGFYCPGCGGTRAVKFLLEGNLLKSMIYHPLVFYTVVVVIAEVISFLLSKCFKKPKWYIKRYQMFCAIGVVLLIVNWVIKNICLVWFGIDLLAI